jgi:stage II sporulation protein D
VLGASLLTVTAILLLNAQVPGTAQPAFPPIQKPIAFKLAQTPPSLPPVRPPIFAPVPAPISLPSLPASVREVDRIRVGISDDAMTQQEYPQTVLTASGPFRLLNLASGQPVLQGKGGETLTITVDKTGFRVASPLIPNGGAMGGLTGPLRLEPTAPGSVGKILSVTRKGNVPSYRGLLEVVRGFSSPAKLSVVNVLSLQDYLKAVVPNELPIRFGYEAVKAQAVAARNYAIRPREKPWPTFDICDSQYCQAYYGMQTETDGTTQALKETDGLVALYNGEPVLALYSSSHGGWSEDYSNAFSEPTTQQFPSAPIPYLAGQPDQAEVAARFGDLRQEANAQKFWTTAATDIATYDASSPHLRWQRQWRREALETTLEQTLREVSKEKSTQPFIQPLFTDADRIGELQRIDVLQRGVSGKLMSVRLVTTTGQWQVSKEFVIRKVLKHNGKMLPSANIVFKPTVDPVTGKLMTLDAFGGGFGHGVGMSQYGASWMSKNGFGFQDILRHYYRGTSIGSIPLVTGPGALPNQALQTGFYVDPDAKAVLCVSTAGSPAPLVRRPVQLAFNGEPYRMTPGASGISRQPISAKLKPGVHNTLTLLPDASAPDRPLRVWVEVYPAKSTQVASAARKTVQQAFGKKQPVGSSKTVLATSQRKR